MITTYNRAQSLVFSSAALRRIANVSAALNVKIEVWAFVVWTWVQGKAPRFVSKKEFLQQFVDFRRAGSRLCYVGYESNGTYNVHSHGHPYKVTAMAKAVVCACEDYKAQVAVWGQGCCKHGYALLNHLGFDSLKDYIKAQ